MSRRLWAVLGALVSLPALADAYDFRIYQLGNPGTASSPNPTANANFRTFARTLGAAITSVNLSPPETLGHSAFAISADLSMVLLPDTSLAVMPTTRAIDRPLLLPSIHLRKGLPWSFELGVRAAWFEQSRMGVATVELKWALNEGFAYLPDIGVRGHVTKLLNSRDFDLTTGGLDLGLGKQFALAGMVTLTPYIGWNLNFIGASSGTVDFNPARTLADADASRQSQDQGFGVFDQVLAAENANNRFYGGVRFIGGYVQLGAEFSYTVLGAFRDPTLGTVRMKDVMAVNFNLGFDF